MGVGRGVSLADGGPRDSAARGATRLVHGFRE